MLLISMNSFRMPVLLTMFSASLFAPSFPMRFEERWSSLKVVFFPTAAEIMEQPLSCKLLRRKLRTSMLRQSSMNFAKASAPASVMRLDRRPSVCTMLFSLTASRIPVMPSSEMLLSSISSPFSTLFFFKRAANVLAPLSPILLLAKVRLVSVLLVSRASDSATTPMFPMLFSWRCKVVITVLTFMASARRDIPSWPQTTASPTFCILS
mmetsp:Transcript_1283/g.2767  ORF Transcript_1283/g.2767 Transcript_1283/m.2767 type:complete len:209 (-) Transcript_1283:480-1106(-)